MKRLDEREKEVDRLMSMDERKRPYNVMFNTEDPTEEELEAYRRKRQRENDPMFQFM
jgi:pre-mRNA-processing factor SLU7